MRTTWEHGWWELHSGSPHSSLSGQVRGDYVGWTECTTRPIRRTEVAGTIIPLIINFGAPYRVFAGVGADVSGADRSSFVAGLYDTWAAVESASSSCALQVNLTPFAAHRLLRVPMHALYNRSEELTALLGARGRTLVERLGNAATWPARFALLDAMLRERLVNAKSVPGEVQWCWDTLAASRGRVRIATLVQYTHWSPARLIAAFRTYCGMTPRSVARAQRFEGVIESIDRALTGSKSDSRVTSVSHAERVMRGRWSTLALEHGYADQSHLVREFAQFAGCSPTAYLRGRLEGGGVVELVTGTPDADD